MDSDSDSQPVMEETLGIYDAPPKQDRDSRISVLFVDHAGFRGGGQQSGLELIRSLDPARVALLYATAPGPLLDDARALGVHTAPLRLLQVRGWRNRWRAPFRLASGVLDLVRLVRRERIQIVHSNTMRSAVFAAPAAKLARVKFVWHVRDLHREQLFLRVMSALADAIIANSEAVANTIRPYAAHKVSVVYNGVTLKDYVAEAGSRAAFRAELGLSDSNPLLGNIGWFAPWKGQHEFVAVASQVAARCPDARFVVVGAATDERYRSYEQQVRMEAREQMGNRLAFVGARSPLAPVLAGLDLLVHCAENEPFGRVLIEAMAMERPVIAFGGGGPDEIIEQGVSGVLIPAHAIDQMAQAAVELAAQPERRATMGRAARTRVEQRFDSRVSAQHVQQIYESLL